MTTDSRRVHFWRALSFLCLLLLILAPTESPGGEQVADIVFTNGRIYTIDTQHTRLQAMALRDGKIAFVGPNSASRVFIGTFTDVNTATTSDYLNQIAAFVKAKPDLPGYRGMGWVNGAAPGIGPLATDLDTIVPNKPVVLRSQDGHSLWANSRALELGHVTKSTPDPPNGKIERLPDGRPSGTLREAAMGSLDNVIPAYMPHQYEAAILHFQKDIAGPLGITQVFIPGLEVNSPQFAAYENLAQAGKLTLRIRAAVTVNPREPVAAQIQAAVAERSKHLSPLFRVDAVKFFVDGVIEGHTGYLLKPYSDAKKYNGNANYRGMPMWPQALLDAASSAALRAGFRLHYHAIGDAAVRMALDAISAAEKSAAGKDLRPAITHLQLVDPVDLPRFKTLGVVAVTQPYWFVSDKYYFWNIQVPYLGKKRADLEYPMQSFFKEGVLVASSSDYPVTLPPDPLDGIETGILRWFQGASNESEILWPAERCTITQMIDSFTINGAKSLFLEKISGSIEPGKSADFIILNRDIFNTPARQIGDAKKTRILATYFQGRTVFSSSEAGSTAHQ
jgi:predicted amidohydrolase YtcJ